MWEQFSRVCWVFSQPLCCGRAFDASHYRCFFCRLPSFLSSSSAMVSSTSITTMWDLSPTSFSRSFSSSTNGWHAACPTCGAWLPPRSLPFCSSGWPEPWHCSLPSARWSSNWWLLRAKAGSSYCPFSSSSSLEPSVSRRASSPTIVMRSKMEPIMNLS